MYIELDYKYGFMVTCNWDDETVVTKVLVKWQNAILSVYCISLISGSFTNDITVKLICHFNNYLYLKWIDYEI